MPANSFKVYPYRWGIISAFILINITIQILWISFGAITLPATQYYAVSDAWKPCATATALSQFHC